MQGLLKDYREARIKVYEQLDSLRVEVDRWLADHESDSPSMTSIANLEYLLHRRHQILDEITSLENELIDKLIETRGESATQDSSASGVASEQEAWLSQHPS